MLEAKGSITPSREELEGLRVNCMPEGAKNDIDRL